LKENCEEVVTSEGNMKLFKLASLIGKLFY